jgi:hypothetical protein
MSNAIVAHLSSDSYASALGITVQSPSPLLALCRKLTEVSTYASSSPLDAYRGETLSLRVRSIGEGAKLEVNGVGTGFIWRSKRRRASLVSQIQPAGVFPYHRRSNASTDSLTAGAINW